MKELTPIATRHKNQVAAMAPFLFMFELQTLDDPPKRFRLHSGDKIVNWGSNSLGEPIKYYPAQIAVGDLEKGSEGDLPTVEVSVGNFGAIPMSLMDSAAGFTGQPARVLVVSTLDLDSGSPIIDETARVAGATVTHEGIQFEITGSEVFQARFPQYIYSPIGCKWGPLGTAECGYNLHHPSAGFISCGVNAAGKEVARPYSLKACQAVGDDEVANGLTPLHPQRYGGEPGMSRG